MLEQRSAARGGAGLSHRSVQGKSVGRKEQQRGAVLTHRHPPNPSPAGGNAGEAEE